MLAQKILWSSKISSLIDCLSSKNFGPKNFISKQLRFKIILGPKIFLVKKIWGLKKMLIPKMNNILTQNILVTKNLVHKKIPTLPVTI